MRKKKSEIKTATDTLTKFVITPNVETNQKLVEIGIGEIRNAMPLAELMRRPNVTYKLLSKIFTLPEISKEAAQQVDIALFYAGYIQKQADLAEKLNRLESKIIPANIDYNALQNLRMEAREKLSQIRPYSIGQASRISGVSPADISVLVVWLETLARS